MTRQKTIDILIYTATGFTIAQGLISFLIVGNRQLYDNISLHYSDSFTWYFIFFFVPLLAGLTFYFWLKNKNISKGLKILFCSLLISQLAFTVTASTRNYNYWGYAFKRPAVFREILKADNVLTCSQISNIYLDSTGIKPFHVVIDTTKSMDNLYGRKDFYYGISDRIFMVFQDRAYINGRLYNFPKTYKNPDLKISKNILKNIERQIQESNLIDATSVQLNGIVTEIITVDNANYIFVGLDGGEVSNDHYPHYEFLFVENNNQYELIKKQRFYTDFAGIEGLEYANIASFFSLLLTVIGLVGTIIIGTTNRIIKNRKKLYDEKNNAL